MEQTDTYNTLAEPAEALYKEKGSKFLCYAYPVSSQEEVTAHLEKLYKQHYDATHHCYAWRIGFRGESFRANDNGEPSSTAGKPILGQLLSREITNTLVVVVRYFGGTKLGVSGLITAYRESAALVLDSATVVERTIDQRLCFDFSYMAMNEVMKALKGEPVKIVEQTFDNLCRIELLIRESRAPFLLGRLEKVEGLIMDDAQR